MLSGFFLPKRPNRHINPATLLLFLGFVRKGGDMQYKVFKEQQLKKDLSQFGLNPTDWQIKTQRSGKVFFCNRKEREFVLLGAWETKAGFHSLKDLKVLSV